MPSESSSVETRSGTGVWLRGRRAIGAALLALFVLGALLRLHEIGSRSLSHPENFVPGIAVPEWTIVPPPRPDTRAVLLTTLDDGHPPTYFLALIPWIRLFGTSHESYRVPSALLGALSILLVFAVARREVSRSWALLPAALLSLHGFHIYWSQLARPYSMAAFLALLSTLFMLRHLERERRLDALGLFASTALALWTQLYAWPLVFTQMLVGALREWGEHARLRTLRVQLAAVIVALPVVAIAIVQDPPTKWNDPRLGYLELGFAFMRGAAFWSEAPAPFVPSWLTIGVTVALLAVSAVGALTRFDRVRARATDGAVRAEQPHWFPAWLLTDLALLSAAGMLALYVANGKTRLALLLGCALPLGLVVLAELLRAVVEPRLRRFAFLARAAAPLALWLALLPPLLMLAVSAQRPSWVARGALVYVPFLLIAAGAGVAALAKRPLVAGVAASFLFAVCASSSSYYARAKAGPRDYQNLARELRANLAPDDAIFVQRSLYTYPPLYYYLPDHLEQLVGNDWGTFVEREQPRRVWLISFRNDHLDLPEEMRAAVVAYRRTDSRHAHNAHAILMERDEALAASDPQASAR